MVMLLVTNGLIQTVRIKELKFLSGVCSGSSATAETWLQQDGDASLPSAGGSPPGSSISLNSSC